MHLPYARVFAPYPTRTLGPDARLSPGRAGQALLAGREFPLVYAGLDQVVDPGAVRGLVFLARNGEQAGRLAERLLETAPHLDAERAAYLVLWAVKHDLLRTAPEG
jgi:hypothetical protein